MRPVKSPRLLRLPVSVTGRPGAVSTASEFQGGLHSSCFSTRQPCRPNRGTVYGTVGDTTQRRRGPKLTGRFRETCTAREVGSIRPAAFSLHNPHFFNNPYAAAACSRQETSDDRVVYDPAARGIITGWYPIQPAAFFNLLGWLLDGISHRALDVIRGSIGRVLIQPSRGRIRQPGEGPAVARFHIRGGLPFPRPMHGMSPEGDGGRSTLAVHQCRVVGSIPAPRFFTTSGGRASLPRACPSLLTRRTNQ